MPGLRRPRPAMGLTNHSTAEQRTRAHAKSQAARHEKLKRRAELRRKANHAAAHVEWQRF